MVLEATIICLDNSEWSRNEDFTPSRLDAQQDTANLVCGAKTQDNPENAVGLLVMGGSRVSVAVAPTPDTLAFLQALHGIRSQGKADFIRGIQTAQLALKHRLNRNQRQRIILFVCSPITATEKQLEQLGKTLKKNNIALDIISFGQVQENSKLLQKLYQAVNSNDTSHLIEVTDNAQTLTRQVMQSAIVAAEGAGGILAGSGGELDEFGVDPSTDPELYMALRLSLEEERARARRMQEQTQTGQATGNAPVTESPTANVMLTERAEGPSAGIRTTEPPAPDMRADNSDRPPTIEEINAMDIDQDLRQALLLSLKELDAVEQPAKRQEPSPPAHEADPEGKRRRTEQDTSSDAALMAQVVKNLAGVNINNPEVQEALRQLPSSQKDEAEPKEGSDNDVEGEE